MKVLDVLTLIDVAVADGATSPVVTSPSIAYSSITGSLVQFDGTKWSALLMPTPTTGAASTVNATTTAVQVLAALSTRIAASIYNAGQYPVLIGLGFVPTASSFSVSVEPGSYLEVPFGFRGLISSITAFGTSALQVTSFS